MKYLDEYRDEFFECNAFALRCTPERPLGAPIVSAEGACTAFYQHRRHSVTAHAGEPA